MTVQEKIHEYLSLHRDEMVEDIKTLIKVDSARAEALPGKPYGEGAAEALHAGLSLFEKHGFLGKNWDNYAIDTVINGKELGLDILAHLDVVPGGDGWTKTTPFEPIVEDGKMYGRGVQDDKGPTIGAFYALKAIKDLGLPLDRRIRVLFGCDEECGSSCVEHYIKVGGELPTIGFTPDAQFPAIFCEKGQTFWYISKKIEEAPAIKVLSIEGGVAKNVVTPKCTLVAEGDLVVEEKDYIQVEKKDGKTIVTAEGLSAHGSTPELGKNAAVRLFDALKGNHFGGDLQKMIDFIMEKVGWETNGAALGIASEDEETGNTTVNLVMIKYDGQELQFTLDIRYPKNITEETVVANVTKNIEAYGLEVENDLHSLLYVSKDSELVQKLTKVYCEETGDTDAQPIAIGGGTYAKSFENMVAFGPIFPGEEEVIHAPNEFAVIDNLVRSIQITAAAMYELAQK